MLLTCSNFLQIYDKFEDNQDCFTWRENIDNQTTKTQRNQKTELQKVQFLNGRAGFRMPFENWTFFWYSGTIRKSGRKKMGHLPTIKIQIW